MSIHGKWGSTKKKGGRMDYWKAMERKDLFGKREPQQVFIAASESVLY